MLSNQSTQSTIEECLQKKKKIYIIVWPLHSSNLPLVFAERLDTDTLCLDHRLVFYQPKSLGRKGRGPNEEKKGAITNSRGVITHPRQPIAASLSRSIRIVETYSRAKVNLLFVFHSGVCSTRAIILRRR